MKTVNDIAALKKRIKDLEKENELLKKKKNVFYTNKKTVKTPNSIAPIFDKASEIVKTYFQTFNADSY